MDVVSKRVDDGVVYAGKYAIEGRHGKYESITDRRISDEAAADARARAELLKNGYVTQKIVMRSFFRHLSVGNIVAVSAPRHGVPSNMTKDRFIVTKVQSVFDDKTSHNIVEAVRYD